MKIRYIPLSKEYENKIGLSEKIIRRKLEREGWIVWRGGSIDILRRKEGIYPNVFRKYKKLHEILEKNCPSKIDDLHYLCQIHHGIPDFICYRKELKFVECKLQYECLSEVQKKCIKKLKELGFKVEIHRVVDHRTKIREALVENGKKIIIEKQKRLTRKLFKFKPHI